MKAFPTILIAAGLVGSLAVWSHHFRRVGHHETVQTSVISGSTDALREVLEAGFDPDTRLDTQDNYERLPPLTIAAVNGNLAAMRVLLEHGADPLVPDTWGRTPITTVAERHRPEALALLIEAAGGRAALGDDILASALIEAAGAGANDCVDVLIDTGMDVNTRGRQGSSAMHAAVGARSTQHIFERILAAGGDPNVGTSRGETPLLACLRTMRRHGLSSFSSRITALIEAGADVNAVSESGETALGSALECSEAVALLLLDAGADPNRRMRSGSMPLHEAIRSGSTPALVEALLAAGADPTREDHRLFWQKTTTVAVADERAADNPKDEDAKAIQAMIREALGLPEEEEVDARAVEAHVDEALGDALEMPGAKEAADASDDREGN